MLLDGILEVENRGSEGGGSVPVIRTKFYGLGSLGHGRKYGEDAPLYRDILSAVPRLYGEAAPSYRRILV